VSVIIPTYKRNQSLGEAIESVKKQTYNEIEIIVVNDDPNTNIESDNNVPGMDICIHHEQNEGVSKSRNDGIRAASGDYIAFLDDDDLWKSKKIEKQVRYIERASESVGLVYTGLEVIKLRGKAKSIHPRIKNNTYEELLKNNFLSTPTVLVRQDCFDRVGLFDTQLTFGEDWEMWLRIAKEYDIICVPEILVTVRQDRTDRLSLNWAGRYKSNKKILIDYGSDLRNYPAAASRRHRLFSVTCIQTKRHKEAAEHLIISLWYQFSLLTSIYLIALVIHNSLIDKIICLREHVIHNGYTEGVIRWIWENVI